MNKLDRDDDFLLRQYLNPEKIEKAPEGFTSKVMAGVNLETVPAKTTSWLRSRSLVPAISAVVTLLLLVTAFLSRGNEPDSLTLQIANTIKDLKIALPEINFSSIFSFDIPVTVVYIFLAIIILTVFDRALFRIFRREK
jgi:uncharacterized membrane protein YoaK (UPF0700 family)